MGAEVPVLLYQAAPRIQPRRAQGRYARLRLAAMLVLLGLFYAAPWLTLNGSPLVWFDLPGRRFHLAGLVLVPQDLIFLTGLLVVAALTLFFFTTIAGRLWCGYACPQTVWTEAFLWIEHWVEGDRHARLKLDRSPWTAQKIVRRGSKHALWLTLGLFTGLSFVAYFVPARELFPAALDAELAGWPLFWSLFYGIATWGNAGFLREQVCKYMCPYARFQSAMFDRDTLIIAYDERRGEPRKSAAANKSSRGDCVDCSVCVQVCPTGIDIRQGLQYECIACAACIDVCDAVMDSVKRPRGLIRYTSARKDAGGGFRLLRPRVIGYGLLWAGLCISLAMALALRTPLQFNVLRDRHALYRSLPDGRVENLYTLKVGNQDARAHVFALSAIDAQGLALDVAPERFELQAGEAQAFAASVASSHARAGAHRVTLSLTATDDPRLARSHSASFLAAPLPDDGHEDKLEDEHDEHP